MAPSVSSHLLTNSNYSDDLIEAVARVIHDGEIYAGSWENWDTWQEDTEKVHETYRQRSQAVLDKVVEFSAAAGTQSTSAPAIESVFAIESTYHFRDERDRPQTRIEYLVDEGWFFTEEAAGERVSYLNERIRDRYEAQIASAERAHEANRERAVRHNHEAQILRAAGVQKTDMAVPKDFTPPSFEAFLNSTSHNTFRVVEIHHSDHELLSLSCGVGSPSEPDG